MRSEWTETENTGYETKNTVRNGGLKGHTLYHACKHTDTELRRFDFLPVLLQNNIVLPI